MYFVCKDGKVFDRQRGLFQDKRQTSE